MLLGVVGLAASNALIRQESQAKEQALKDKDKALGEKDSALETARYQEGLARQNAVSAETQRGIAVANAKTAETNELLALRRFYAAQMNLAARAWEEEDTPRVLELLESQRPRFGQEDLRAFEWYALWQLCNQQLRYSRQESTGSTYTVAYSPDSSLIALGSTDGTVKLLDATSGREIQLLHGGGKSRKGAVAFSPDGKLLAQGAGPTQDEVTLWDVGTGEAALVLSGAGNVIALAFSSDGQTLAAGTQEGAVTLWDLATGVLKDAWKTDAVLAIAFSPDGTLLATTNDWSSSLEKATLVWDLTLTPPSVVRKLPPRGNALAFSADGKRFAVGTPSVLSLFDTTTWKEIPVKKGPWGRGRSLAFIPGRDAIAVGVESRSVKIIDLATGTAATLPHHSPVRALAVSPDGKAVAAIAGDAVLKIWNLGPGANPDVVDVAGYIGSLAFSPDGQTLAVGVPGMVKLIDVNTGAAKGELKGHTLTVGTLAFFRDSKTLAAGSSLWAEPGELKIWDLRTGKERVPAPEFKAAAHAIAIAPDERTLAVGGPQGELTLFDLVASQRLTLLKSPSLTALAYSPDGKLLVSAGAAGNLTVRDPRTGTELLTFGPKEVSNYSWGLACSPDSKLLATGSGTGLIRLWELPSGRLHATLRGSTTAIKSVAFFADGKTLASASEGGEVRLWDVTTGQERITFRFGNRLAVSADGKMLAAGPTGLQVRLLRASTAPEALARKSEFDPDDPESPLTQIDGGDRLLAAGQKLEAEKAYRGAQQRLQILVEEFPQVAEYYQELSRCLLRLSVLLPATSDKAEEVRRDLLRMQDKIAAAFPAAAVGVTPASMAWEWGNALKSSARLDDAERAFRQGIVLAENLVAASGRMPQGRLHLAHNHHGLGHTLWAKQQPLEAEAECRAALKLFQSLTDDYPANPDHWWLMTQCCVQLSKFLRDAQRLQEAAETDWQAHTAFEHLVAHFPTVPYCREGLMVRYWNRGAAFPLEAEQLYRCAIDLLPAEELATSNRRATMIAACNKLIDLLKAENRAGEVEAVYRQSLELLEKLAGDRPKEPEIRDELAKRYGDLAAYLRTNRQLPEAEAAYRQAIEMSADLAAAFPDNPAFRRTQDRSYLQLIWFLIDHARRLTDAKKICRERLAVAEQTTAEVRATHLQLQKSGDLLHALGWALQHQAGFAAAAVVFQQNADVRERLIATPEGQPNDRYELERTYTALGIALSSSRSNDESIAAHQRALETSEQLVTEFPTDSKYLARRVVNHSNLAKLLRETGRLDEAESYYRRILEFYETHPEQKDPQSLLGGALIGLAQVLSQGGQTEKAAAIYGQLLKIKPDSSISCNNLAWLLATCAEPKFRNPSQAMELAGKAVALEPQNGIYWNTLGVAQYRAGDWAGAIESLRKSDELTGETALAFNGFFLAMSHLQRENKDEAGQWYDKAVQWMEKNDKQNEELQRFRIEAEELLELEKKTN